MDKWLVVHSLESYAENPRMIGFPAKATLDGSLAKGRDARPVPAFESISRVTPGDRIVYYCKGDYVIKGIYEVVQPHFAKEGQWPDSPFQFETRPVLELDDPYDFRLLVSSLDLFGSLADRKWWGGTLQGKFNSIKRLTDHDYRIIEEAVAQAEKGAEQEQREAAEVPEYRHHLLVQ